MIQRSVVRVWRFARTIRHLRMAQMAQRIRIRAQLQVLAQLGPVAEPCLRPRRHRTLGWPTHFAALDARCPPAAGTAEDIATGTFCFLRQSRSLGDPPDWAQRGAERLWRFHLNYLEWAWLFAEHPNRRWARSNFARLWQSWKAASALGVGDAWSPYVASLRAWALCGVYESLIAGSEIEQSCTTELTLLCKFLRYHLEFDVGGNHLIKNLKAVIGLGVAFDNERLVASGIRHLRHQLAIQVLDDGGHYERSPFYHAQVLGDLIDMANLLRAAGHPSLCSLDNAVGAMRSWLGRMIMKDGDIPLFNDSTLVGTDRLRLLEPMSVPPALVEVLQPSGYVVMQPDRHLHLVADCGLPCPVDLPAHCHADGLSFELAVDGQRVIVDSGTSTYEQGPRRDYERSTWAHNTVTVDGSNQTEVWGAFRAGRRAHPRLDQVLESPSSVSVTASHDGYRYLAGRPLHRRTWKASPARIEIIDELIGSGYHEATGVLHLAPDAAVACIERGVFLIGSLRVAIADPTALKISIEPPGQWPEGFVASSFGPLSPASCVLITANGWLPLRIQVTVTLEKDCVTGQGHELAAGGGNW